MSVYHKYLSRFLIFFSILFIIFLFFIETSVGFKWIFNLTNRLFLGFKVEEISGNWRNFTLKNISYDTIKSSIQANSIHVILDIKSLFKISTIIEDIEIKNLIITFRKNKDNNFSKKEHYDNFFEKNRYIKYPIILKNIHIDKIFFQTDKENICFLNILTGIKFSHHNITIFPSYIDKIQLGVSHNINSQEELKKKYLVALKNFLNTKKIYNILSFSSSEKKNVLFNINLTFLYCKKINLKNYNTNNLEIKLQAQIKNNVLKINNIVENSTFLKIKSYGKVVFYKNRVISCVINNQILAPRLHNRMFSIIFKAHLGEKIKFNLQYNDLHKMNLIGTMFLDNFNDVFYLNLKSKRLFFSIKKDCILKFKNLNLVFKGNFNNYSLFIKNIFKIKDLPSILIQIDAQGSLKNIFFKQIKVFPIKNTIFKYKTSNLIKNIIHHQHMLELIGKTDVLGVFDKNTYNIYFSQINMHGNIMQKKLSILGSFYYKNFDFLKIPGVKISLGRNTFFCNGFLGKKFNIHSSVYADNLDYFSSNLKGIIRSESNIYGNHMFPIMIKSNTFGKNISVDNFYLKAFKISTNIDMKDNLLGEILLDIKKMYFSNFYIDSLYFKADLNNDKQQFLLFFKSNILSFHCTVNSFYDNKTGNWHGFFKNINIQTVLGKIINQKNFLFFYYNLNLKKDNYFKNNLQRKIFLPIFFKKTFLSSIFKKSFINFQTQISINTQLKWIFQKHITNGKVFIHANNINLTRKIKEKILSENIECINLSVNFKKSNFKSQWILKKLINSTEKENISGYLNIFDVYNKRNIEGKFFISDFPISFINFLTTSFKKIKGTFKSNVVLYGTLYRPKVLSDIFIQDVLIKSDNILNYINFLFSYPLGKIDTLKINQSIIIKKANILLTLNTLFNKSNNIEWNLSFNSEKIAIAIFSKIKIKFSSQLNLHYLLSKYDLMGYVKCALFYFKINEKNFHF